MKITKKKFQSELVKLMFANWESVLFAVMRITGKSSECDGSVWYYCARKERCGGCLAQVDYTVSS